MRPYAYAQLLYDPDDAKKQDFNKTHYVQKTIKVTEMSYECKQDSTKVIFTTKYNGDSYLLANGKYISLFYSYYYDQNKEHADIFRGRTPLLVITNVNVDMENNVTVEAMDEMSYLMIFTTAIPVTATSEQQKFIDKNFGKNISTNSGKKPPQDITLQDFLKYLASIIEPHTYYKQVLNKTRELFFIPKGIAPINIGAWSPNTNDKISDIFKLINEHYFITVHSLGSSYCNSLIDFSMYASNTFVRIPGWTREGIIKHCIDLKQDVNVISEDLTKNSPAEKTSASIVKGTWKYVETKNKVKTRVVEEMYAYFDDKNEIKYTTNQKEIKKLMGVADTVSFSSKMDDDRKKYILKNLLLRNEYLGIFGNVNTFFYNINLVDVFHINFNPKLIKEDDNRIDSSEQAKYDEHSYSSFNEVYGLDNFSINYDSNGLFMTISPREVVKL